MTHEEYCKIMDNSNFYIDSQNPYDMKIKEALEKSIPRKPILNFGGDWGEINEYYCPCCNKYLTNDFDEPLYCFYCGQAIDWSER